MLGFFKRWADDSAEMRKTQKLLTALLAEQGVNFMHLHPDIHKFLMGAAKETDAESAVHTLNTLIEQVRAQFPELTESEEAEQVMQLCKSLNGMAGGQAHTKIHKQQKTSPSQSSMADRSIVEKRGSMAAGGALMEALEQQHKLPSPSKQHILGKLASTIDFVITDAGLSTLLSGSIVMRVDFSTGFQSGRVVREDNIIASVCIADLKEAEVLKMALEIGLDDASLLSPFVDDLCYGLCAEFENQSTTFKALR
jgi:hypothetical protein